MWKSIRLGAKTSAASETTLIASSALIAGDVRFSGVLELEGIVQGAIHGERETHAVVRILPGGQVHGDVHAPIVVVNGVVTGNVHSSEHVELAARAVVHGDVEYNLIEMTKGARVEGRLHFRPGEDPPPAPSSADMPATGD